MAMANHNTVGHAQANNIVGPLPHSVRDPPYRMPYGWNTKDPNEDMVSNRSQLQNMVKREYEGFKTYTQRWRKLVA
ncbi:hypothetical protein CR513_33640, partial [Mucuna pruriens]